MSLAQELVDFFSARPSWMRDAARRIFTSQLTPLDQAELITLCKLEAGLVVTGAIPHSDPLRIEHIGTSEDTVPPTLVKLSAITSINALANNAAFPFQPTGLTVFYGENGAGKSGVSRILKSLCGARRRPKVHSNVFIAGDERPSCSITYRQGANEISHVWSPNDGAIPALQTISVFDSEEASVYVTAQNELTYEPKVLKCLSELVRCCDYIKSSLQTEIDSLVSRMPQMPGDLNQTESGRWHNGLTSQTTPGNIDDLCRWSATDGENLQRLQQLLATADPSSKAKELEKTEDQLQQLLTKLQIAHSAVEQDSLLKLNQLRQDIAAKENALKEAADKVFAGSVLEGVASNTWKILWDSARQYSREFAYPSGEFPFVGHDAVCVLCQQPLNESAKSKFLNLEDFVTNQLSQTIEQQKKALASHTKHITASINFIDLDSTLLACAIQVGSSLFKEIHTFVDSCSYQFQQAENDLAKEGTPPLYAFDFKTALDQCVAQISAERQSYVEASKSEDRSKHQHHLQELKARKWLSENKAAIVMEVDRLRKRSLLDEACRLTVSNSITLKKNALSAQLMGEAFADRFTKHLVELGGERLRLKVSQSGSKGKVKFGLVLKDSFQQAALTEVLSEGEFRITSLAAFLADTALDNQINAFIFDDPVSSLDHNFENSVSRCLARLAQNRQVIVFTHRLTFLKSLMNATAGKLTAHYLQQINSTCGYISGVPVHTATPNELLDEITRTNDKCRKAAQDGDAIGYGEQNKLACSYLRLAVERHIETVLLRGMIDRFSTRLKTMNVLGELLAIQKSDCEFLEALMTKYSFPEHIQADEEPFKPIPPEQIDADVASLRKWVKAFKAAVNTLNKPAAA